MQKSTYTAEVLLQKRGFTVGVEIKDRKVLKIYPSSVFLGQLFVNDVIRSVNAKPVANTAEFYKVVSENSPGKLLIEYERDETVRAVMRSVPGGRVGFEQFELDLEWSISGGVLGLLVTKDNDNKVIVSMVEDGSVVAKKVEAGDILLKVNDTQITDKEQARTTIYNSVNKQKKVKLLLERQKKDANAQKSICGDLRVRSITSIALANQPPSVIQPPVVASPTSAATTTTTTSTIAPPSAVSAPTGAVVAAAMAGAAPTPVTPSMISAAIKTEKSLPPAGPSKSGEALAVVGSVPEPPKYVPPPPMAPPAAWKKSPNADPTLPADVMAIMEANKAFFNVAPTEPGIIRLTSLPDSPHIVQASLTDPAPEIETAFDPSPKPLKKTPKRVGS